MAHTPGPWEAVRIRDTHEDSHSGWWIESPAGSCFVYCGNSSKSEANARLIAAAPALLEALRAYRDHRRRCSACYADSGFLCGEAQLHLNAALAAAGKGK